LVILLKPTDFGLAVRNTDPDVGKVLLNEMGNATTASSLAARSPGSSGSFAVAGSHWIVEDADRL
jgi:hypothetical protein